MKILIIGVNGFIGNNLSRYFKNKNFEVFGTSSKKINNKYCIKTFNLKIGDLIDVDDLTFDWVIHCVYVKNKSNNENTFSTISWAKDLQKNGVKNQIFISSIRAINGNSSNYTLIKQETELWFLKNGLNVIRPGLVVGDGGLFKSMMKNVKNLPLMPLINGGNQDVKLIGINDLMNEINKIFNNVYEQKDLNIFYPDKFVLKYILKDIGSFFDKKIVFIKIPYIVVFYLVRVFEILHINIGLTSKNIEGLNSKDVDIKSNINYTKNVLQILKENFSE